MHQAVHLSLYAQRLELLHLCYDSCVESLRCQALKPGTAEASAVAITTGVTTIPAVTAVMTAMTACGAMFFDVSMPISGLVCRWHTSQFLVLGTQAS